MIRYSFSGHDTFYCRNYWLKKGLDHVWKGKRFNDEAVISLGVGKNMVNAIRFWLRAFGVFDKKDAPSELANKIFRDDGFDPFCEDIATVWLLHYLLVTTEYSTIYSLIFNKLRKQRIEFNREHIQIFLERSCRSANVRFNKNSIKKDVGVFLNNYTKPEKPKGVEAEISGLLYELDLVQRLDKSGQLKWYKIENRVRPELPAEIILFCILTDERYGSSISFNELLNDYNSVGGVFALSSNGLMSKIEELLKKYKKQLVFTDDGGVRLLQIKKTINPWNVLNEYYEA